MWAAQMAVSQNIGVPWIMCQQYDAPDPVVSILFNYNSFRLFNLLIQKIMINLILYHFFNISPTCEFENLRNAQPLIGRR